MEIFKIAEPCPLIDPSQVVITKGEIFVADPVLTPLGIAWRVPFVGVQLLMSCSTSEPFIFVALQLLNVVLSSYRCCVVHASIFSPVLFHLCTSNES